MPPVARVCLSALVALLSLAPHASAASPILQKLSVPPREVVLFGQKTVYYEAGDGPVLILLANLSWDAHAWAANVPELSKHFRVIAIDVVGTGRSDKPLIEYKMDTWTDFVAEFMRVKNIRSAIVGGAAMGGALGVQFALDHPELTSGVLVAASNSGPGKRAGGDKTPPFGPSLAGTRRSLRLNFFDQQLVTEDVVRQRFEQRLRMGDGYTIQRHMADHRPPYSEEELQRIKVPALFVWCRQDAVTPLQWGEDYAAAVPGAKLAVIDRCGHYPNIEKPAEFNRAVIETFARRSAEAATPPPAPPREQLFVAIYERGPHYDAAKTIFEQHAIKEHIAHHEALGERLIAAGPLRATAEQNVAGVIVLKATDLAAARRWFDNDPAVVAGTLKGTVAQWGVRHIRAYER